MDAIVVPVGQIKKSVWVNRVLRGTMASVDPSGQHDLRCLPGATRSNMPETVLSDCHSDYPRFLVSATALLIRLTIL
jgi:hypothetical protein